MTGKGDDDAVRTRFDGGKNRRRRTRRNENVAFVRQLVGSRGRDNASRRNKTPPPPPLTRPSVTDRSRYLVMGRRHSRHPSTIFRNVGRPTSTFTTATVVIVTFPPTYFRRTRKFMYRPRRTYGVVSCSRNTRRPTCTID